MNRLREITKIARNLSTYKNGLEKKPLPAFSYETIRLVVKHPGVNASFLAQRTNVDKSLVSRTVSSLIKEEYLTAQPDKDDKRSKKLYPTQKATTLKLNNEAEEDVFYNFLEGKIPPEDKDAFYRALDVIYLESKTLRHNRFEELKNDEKHQDK